MNKREQTPNLFVIGAPKCGTTAFVQELSSHPEIFVGELKETRFFDARTIYDFPEDAPIKSLNDYLELYSSEAAQEAKYRVDGSVFNMYREDSIQDILKMSPNAKFIAILRDPLTASKSMHVQRLKYADTAMREISTNFFDCWDALEERKNGNGFPPGCRSSFLFRYDLIYRYELYLPFLNDLIPPENRLFIRYETYRGQPETVHAHVMDFLQLEHAEIAKTEANPSYVIQPTAKDKLVAMVSKRTRTLRNKLGIDRSQLKFLDPFLLPQKLKTTYDTSRDDEVKNFFADSYAAIEATFDRQDTK
jgi:hypothetical protein